MFLSASGVWATVETQTQQNVSFGCTWQGFLTASAIILHIPMALGVGQVTFPISMSGSSAHLLIAPSGTVTISILKDGVQFATMVFSPGQNWATFTGPSTAVVLVPPTVSGGSGDYLTVILPGTQDTAAQHLGFQLVGATAAY
jgi:hypothetical protein